MELNGILQLAVSTKRKDRYFTISFYYKLFLDFHAEGIMLGSNYFSNKLFQNILRCSNGSCLEIHRLKRWKGPVRQMTDYISASGEKWYTDKHHKSVNWQTVFFLFSLHVFRWEKWHRIQGTALLVCRRKQRIRYIHQLLFSFQNHSKKSCSVFKFRGSQRAEFDALILF